MVILHPGTARQYAPVIFGMGLCGCFGEMAADGFRAAFMLFRELCGGLLAVAVKLPSASGSRRFSDRNRRWRLPITLLRHCDIADVSPAQCLRALQTCLSDHGAPFS